MSMHKILIKSGPAAAGIIGALHTRGVQSDGALRYRFFFLVAGHYRGRRLVRSTHQDKNYSRVPLFNKTPTILAQRAGMIFFFYF